VSPRHWDRVRDDLTAAVRRHLKRFPEDRDRICFVQGIGPVTVHRSDLWEIT
jgi:hypothetical protein